MIDSLMDVAPLEKERSTIKEEHNLMSEEIKQNRG